MRNQTHTVFPKNGHYPAMGLTAEEVMLEGMKVLFDDKVGLYPVNLVAKPDERKTMQEQRDGHGGRTRRVPFGPAV
jgi:hypothetical protein